MDDINELFDVFEESEANDPVGLYLGVQDAGNETAK